MPQHEKLSKLPLRLPPIPNDLPPALRQYLEQLHQSLVATKNAESAIDICSGLTKFSDSVNAGYFLGFTRNDTGYDNGMPVFVVGDRSTEKYFQFDGSDLSLGRETQLIGADAYSNASTFYHTFFDSLDACVVSNASLDTSTGRLKLGNAAGNSTGYVYRVAGGLINNPTFLSGRVRFKFNASLASGNSGTDYFMVGTRQGAGSNGFGFARGFNGVLSGITRRNGTDTTVALDAGSGYYEALLTGGEKVEWYRGGVKVGEQTDATKLPLDGTSKSSGPEALFYIEHNVVGATSNEIYFGEWFTLFEH